MPTRRYKMTLAYDGTGFHGWQEQSRPDPAAPPLRTVQAVVLEAVSRTVGRPVAVQGASRTDAGVHALGQAAHFDAETRIPTERLAMAINSRLPEDVEVLSVRRAPDGFDATRDALEKQYRYRLWVEGRRPLQWRGMVYRVHAELDAGAMREAAARLVGRHDFGAFASAGHGRQSTVRTLFGCDVVEREPADRLDGRQVQIVVRGDGFLYRMVRIIAGTLVEVGRGRWDAGYVDRLLAEPRRGLAGPTLPPEGLCLEWVRYPAEAEAETGGELDRAAGGQA